MKFLVDRLNLSILRGLIPDGIEYGTSLLVEYEPDSLWYETSLTLAAQALKDGVRTDYHTFQHMPEEIRKDLTKLGLDIKKLEDAATLRILDSYTIQTGLTAPEIQQRSQVPRHYSQSLKLADWSIADVQRIKAGVPDMDKRRLHIDDNTGILLQYNEEKTFIDNWRTRSRPHTKVQEIVLFNSLPTGASSDAFTKQFETLSDCIIDLETREKGDLIEHYLRVRIVRGQRYESRWRRLQLLDNGEVALTD